LPQRQFDLAKVNVLARFRAPLRADHQEVAAIVRAKLSNQSECQAGNSVA
jgi:hypothetical protein